MPTLRTLRRRAGLTQDQLADRSGIDQTTISALESGKVPDPRTGTIRRLATALRLSLNDVHRALSHTMAARARAVTLQRGQARKANRVWTTSPSNTGNG